MAMGYIWLMISPNPACGGSSGSSQGWGGMGVEAASGQRAAAESGAVEQQ